MDTTAPPGQQWFVSSTWQSPDGKAGEQQLLPELTSSRPRHEPPRIRGACRAERVFSPQQRQDEQQVKPPSQGHWQECLGKIPGRPLATAGSQAFRDRQTEGQQLWGGEHSPSWWWARGAQGHSPLCHWFSEGPRHS